MAEERTVFHIKINGGAERRMLCRSSLYALAAAAVPAIFDVDLPMTVEIWVPKLLPHYGPYFYRIEHDEYLNIVVRSDLRLELNARETGA